MTRFASTANQTAAAAQVVSIAICVDLHFVSGHARFNDSNVVVPIGGNDYLPIGKFGGIDAVTEGTDIVARPITMSLSGIDTDILAEALPDTTASNYQSRPVTVYMALFNPDSCQLIDTPEVLWEGLMNQMILTLDRDQSSISLTCEHRWRSPTTIARYTDEDQQLRYTGDRFFDLLPKIAGFRGTWGGRSTNAEFAERNPGYRRFGNLVWRDN